MLSVMDSGRARPSPCALAASDSYSTDRRASSLARVNGRPLMNGPTNEPLNGRTNEGASGELSLAILFVALRCVVLLRAELIGLNQFKLKSCQARSCLLAAARVFLVGFSTSQLGSSNESTRLNLNRSTFCAASSPINHTTTLDGLFAWRC